MVLDFGLLDIISASHKTSYVSQVFIATAKL